MNKVSLPEKRIMFCWQSIPAEYCDPNSGYNEIEALNEIGRTSLTDTTKKFCSKPKLRANDLIDEHDNNLNESHIVSMLENLAEGGKSSQKSCFSKQTLAIIIPYRNRYMHLMDLLRRLHKLLSRQNCDYTVFLVEQAFDEVFNKGKIMNAATKEILKEEKFNCFIYHDVDMLPIDDRNIYSCGSEPRHLSPALDEMRFQLPYSGLVGGVLALNRRQLDRTNGFSNEYWGWGAEDDDMHRRIMASGFRIDRPQSSFGRYKMVKHKKRLKAKGRFKLLKNWMNRWQKDGLSNIVDLGYKIISVRKQPLFTNLTIDIGSPPDDLEEDNTTAQGSPVRFLAIFFCVSISIYTFKEL
ncbi:DgyrCDS9314 [Dimorphilus gyrociliatus]|uniref:Beta-1,4-galactosyltransferase n=1 Tax=Dimorphilus gyrociliatus TaxID=2664684 RepID=A0A7I8VYU7_9ANNE|nr:DgyrCDS9314 [Dimorphilus gyrociliatus]